MRFDTFVTVDWSAGNAKGPTPSTDAIWVSVMRDGEQEPPKYFRSRQAIEPWLTGLIEAELTAGRRACLGFDFAFGYPAGFGAALTGSDDPLAVWRWFEERVKDAPKANNRFEVASGINKALGAPMFWGCPKGQVTPYLSMTKRDASALPFAEKRAVEARASGAFTVWQLAYAGAVGSQVIMGLPVLERLRQTFAGQVAVWPFEDLGVPIALVEVWPALFKHEVAAPQYAGWIKDAAQVHVVTEQLAQGDLAARLNVPPTPEGWIFGVPA